MIREDYVTFEQAKELKELGFPQDYNDYHDAVYNDEDYEDEYEIQRMVLQTELRKAGTLSHYSISVPNPKSYAPTLSLVQKWLRNDKGIEIFPYRETNYIFGKAMVNTNYSLQIILCNVEGYPKNSTLCLFEVFDTPEQALSAGIDKCIELLKEK